MRILAVILASSVAASAWAAAPVVVRGEDTPIPGEVQQPLVTVVIPRAELSEATRMATESMLPKIVAAVEQPPIE